jgi:hypothetical protein
MSRALGAAFLNHQVEQLEKSVNSWREREKGRGWKKTGALVSPNTPKHKGNNAARDESSIEKRRRSDEIKTRDGFEKKDTFQKPNSGNKTADIIVVDASVLVHALYQVKQWCREDREEIIIVPLEGSSYRIYLANTRLSQLRHTYSIKHPRSAQKGYIPACTTSSCRLAYSRGTSWNEWTYSCTA